MLDVSWLSVACGGAIGASLRYAISLYLPFTGGFPWATWWANILGCLCVGIFVACAERFSGLNAEWRLFLVVGILGGFTTFSSFSLEIFLMLKQHLFVLAFIYMLSSLCVGLIVVMMGYVIFKALLS